MKRKTVVFAQALATGLVLLALVVSYDLLSRDSYFARYAPFRKLSKPETSTDSSSPAETDLQDQDGDQTLFGSTAAYVKAIMDPEDTSLERLACPRPDVRRYGYLMPKKPSKPTYFFALDFRENVRLLPRLMGSIIEAVRFLGTSNCVVSIVEGNSNDGTFEVLDALRSDFEKLGVPYHFQRSDLDPSEAERIKRLAQLRNLALEPLTKNPQDYAGDASVIFINDVAACVEDILELVHQAKHLDADMVCAVDWSYLNQDDKDPTFYDVWIARTLSGDSFFDIPPSGSWENSQNLFWNAKEESERFESHKPFQVFACWNGATVIRAKALFEFQFRWPKEKECFQGEPQLFCKDMWLHGYRKIAVIPSVHLAYDNEQGTRLKAAKGYTSQWVGQEDEDESWKIQWRAEPPKTVRCMPEWSRQSWPPWDETFEHPASSVLHMLS